ncbi:MAG: hypothetical protein FWH53_00900 [Leptospirales bacterium]|nr:hypothetical protein [Leptospirales bacterium]
MKNDIISLISYKDNSHIFTPEFQNGFFIYSNQGKSIFEFLTEDCLIASEYISENIRTIMINGGPVDDIFGTKISEGSICALSGALPGILGAMMRMGSPYAAMRESITAKTNEPIGSEEKTVILLKLFNIVLHDLKLDFLKKGILLEKVRFYELFVKNESDLDINCKELLLNFLPIDKSCLKDYLLAGNDLVEIRYEIIKDEGKR